MGYIVCQFPITDGKVEADWGFPRKGGKPPEEPAFGEMKIFHTMTLEVAAPLYLFQNSPSHPLKMGDFYCN